MNKVFTNREASNCFNVIIPLQSSDKRYTAETVMSQPSEDYPVMLIEGKKDL